MLKRSNFKCARTALCLIFVASILTPGAPAQTEDEEFVGPFNSWSNLQRDYGTDSAALQRALNETGTPHHSSSLFIPAGTYCVDQLVLIQRLGISIEGADPATTVLKYCGPEGGTLLRVDGIAYSRIGRLTFDCSNRADVAIDQAWDRHHPNFDTANEYSDVVFRNCPMAIRGGNPGSGFAETTVMRAHFGPSSGTCILLKNFNALDLWVWYSLFDRCETGISNNPGAGNFSVYNSVFRKSAKADMSIRNTGGFNIRNNTSIDSAAFFTASGVSAPAYTNIQGNKLIRDAWPAIVIQDQGPALVIDNQVVAPKGVAGPALLANALGDTDILTAGNIWTARDPVSVKGRYITFDDKTVSTLDLQEPVLPGTPPDLHRRVFEVAAGSAAADIQRVIDAAAKAGSRAIVHIAEGDYGIDSTLEIPRRADLQIVGDGWLATRLKWTVRGTGPVFHVNGPSKVIFRELGMSGAKSADSIVIDGIDQPGSRVYLQQTQVRSNISAGLFVDGLDYTTVDLRNFEHSGAAPGPAVKVKGGKLAAMGKPAGGKTNLFSGASSGNALSYDLSDGGRLLVRDIWYESGSPGGWAHLSGDGTFTAQGDRIALPPLHSPAAIELSNFHGLASLLTSKIDDRIVTSGDGANSRVLILGIEGGENLPGWLLNNSSPAAWAASLLSRDAVHGGSSLVVPDRGTADPVVMRRMLAQTRGEQPGIIGKLPGGISDVRLYRVMVENSETGIHLRP